MERKIVHINEDLCNGCGLCIDACHEAAIELVDGKARLVSDEYCDGLGDCLPECPTGAIELITRSAEPFDEAKVEERVRMQQQQQQAGCTGGCPGAMGQSFAPRTPSQSATTAKELHQAATPPELRQWPIQLSLINPQAAYLDGAHLLIAADCAAYAYADFHRDFIRDRVTVIGCPKLDDTSFYEEKLARILSDKDIRSVTVVRMEVPCCGGLVHAVKNAMLGAGKIVPYREVTISVEGQLRND